MILIYSELYDSCFAVVCKSGMMFIYASEQDYERNSGEPAYEVQITHKHSVNEITTKEYVGLT